MQSKKLALLKELNIRASRDAGARSMTSMQLSAAIGCVSPPNVDTAAEFCHLVNTIARAGGPHEASNLLRDTGTIPVLFACLRAWPAERRVVYFTCWPLYFLACYGNEDTKQAIRSVHDLHELLSAAAASGLEKSKYDGFSAAATVLARLSVSIPVEPQHTAEEP